MILKWLPLSIVLDVLSCTDENMFNLPRKGCFIQMKQKVDKLHCYLKGSCLLNCSMQFMVLTLRLLSLFYLYLLFFFRFFTFSCFLGGVPGILVFFLGLWVFRTVAGCSGVPVFRVPLFLELLHAL